MQFGFFDDINKEYVITTPETPLPWINYLGCENFFSLKSNTGGGYCFYKDILKMRIPYGILDGSHPRHQLRIIHVVTDLDIQ